MSSMGTKFEAKFEKVSGPENHLFTILPSCWENRSFSRLLSGISQNRRDVAKTISSSDKTKKVFLSFPSLFSFFSDLPHSANFCLHPSLSAAFSVGFIRLRRKKFGFPPLSFLFRVFHGRFQTADFSIGTDTRGRLLFLSCIYTWIIIHCQVCKTVKMAKCEVLLSHDNHFWCKAFCASFFPFPRRSRPSQPRALLLLLSGLPDSTLEKHQT